MGMADAKRQKRDAEREQLLQQATRLHPLSAACLHLADQVLSEVVDETVQVYARAHASEPLPLPREQRALLEGWTEEEMREAALSQPLREVLAMEVEAMARCAKEGDGASTSASEDVFGNRPPKTCSDAVVCPNCGTQVAANRLAPHMERCMLGRGRATAKAARDNIRATSN